MKTSLTLAPTGAIAGKELDPKLSDEVPVIPPLHSVVFPRARSSLVRGLLESLRRDTYPNPPFTGEESQTGHRGGLDRYIPPEGEAFVDKYIKNILYEKVGGI